MIQYLNSVEKVTFVLSETGWAKASAEIVTDNAILGSAGIISDKLIQKYDFPAGEICAAELDLEKVFALCGRQTEFRQIPKFPAIERDLSIIIDESVQWAAIEKAVRAKAPEALETVRFVEVYHGKNIPEGKKSIMLTIVFRDEDGTLTHDAVDKFQSNIVTELESSTGAKLRSV